MALEPSTEGYQVKLEIFEGPLDLLLFLIRKKKIDIHDIPIAQITRDYLEYLERKDRINLDREAEFLFIASLLIYIKSQLLLPRETETAEGEDPRRILVDRLVEYQKIKAVSSVLRNREEEQLLHWRRTFLPPLPEEDPLEGMDVSLFNLAEAFFLIMKRKSAGDFRVIKGREVTIGEKMTELLGLLERESVIDYKDYFETQESLEEALISFFCLLELIKSFRVIAVQEELFQTIKVWLRKDFPRNPDHE
jgi:segregation and condensation protein A